MHATALLSTLALAIGVSASGGFFDSCPTNNLYYSTLNSQCNGKWYSIDLNQDIGNDGGTLYWGGQNYFDSCASNAGGNCNLEYAEMICQCVGNSNAMIDLDQHVAFDGQRLYFN